MPSTATLDKVQDGDSLLCFTALFHKQIVCHQTLRTGILLKCQSNLHRQNDFREIRMTAIKF